MTENEIAKQVVDAAYKIHTRLGPGLLESAYEVIPVYELRKRGLCVTYQQPIPVMDVRIKDGITRIVNGLEE